MAEKQKESVLARVLGFFWALIRFALSYDVTVAIVGCSNAREVKTLAAAGRHLGPLSRKEKAELMERLEPYARRLAFYRGVL